MSFFSEQVLLIISDDPAFFTHVSDHLTEMSLKVVIAHSLCEALEIFDKVNPQVVITDYNPPQIDSLNILKQIKLKADVPVIVATTVSEIGGLVEEIQNNGGDYIIKPLHRELLLTRLNSMLGSPANTLYENSLADVIGSFHSIHNVKNLFEKVYTVCKYVSGAHYALLHFYNKETKTLNIIQPEDTTVTTHPVLTGNDEWAIPNWVFFNRKIIHVQLGQSTPEMEADLYRCSSVYALSMPLCSDEDIIGVITLFHKKNGSLVGTKIINALNMVLYQASLAYNNLIHFATVNQKLDELLLVSTYSEKLMGLVDKLDVIRSLFETSFKYFPIDVVGFLVTQKRSHDFWYWSRGIIDENGIKDVCKDTVNQFNHLVDSHVQENRVRIRKLPQQEIFEGTIKKPLSFTYVIPVCWDELKFGAIYFGAVKELKNEQEKKAMLMSLVSQTRIALSNSKLYSDMKENYIRTIKALAIAVDAKDTYTHGHSENVMNIAEEIAREMGLDEKGIGIIRDAGLLHDIGKIGIPGYILNKPGPLTYEEFNGIMKTHSTLGANIVKEVPFLHDLHKLILYHHEHFDGGGYPENLKGDQIPLGARILHVADAFEAMTSNRPYRNSLGREEAFKRLIECKGKQFDPAVIEAFIRLAAKKGWIEPQGEASLLSSLSDI